jgi:aminopeptidase N
MSLKSAVLEQSSTLVKEMWTTLLSVLPDTPRCWHGRAAVCGACMVVANVRLVAPPSELTATPSYGRYYRLELHVDPAKRRLDGIARLVLRRAGGATDARLFAGPSLEIDSVNLADRRTAFERRGDTLVVPLGASVAESQSTTTLGSVDLRVFYHSDSTHPALAYDVHAGVPVASTYGLPYSARAWWPTPGSTLAKADSADVIVTVPEALVAVSNGRLVSRTTDGHGLATYQWSTRHPIYPDVISLAIADYAHWQGSASLDGRFVPLQFYVFHDDSAKAADDFAHFPEIIRFFSDRFGPYPYSDEKYGVAEFATESFREHQTIPSLGPRFITGDGRNEWILAHELAHQWFGNSLSVRNWSDAWLNEGLATYAALLWREHHDGRAAYDAEIARNAARAFEGTISVSDSSNIDAMFTGTTFYKTALMLHTLRTMLGDERFADALRGYATDNAFGLVTASDFERRMAAACGRPLDEFFRDWLTTTRGYAQSLRGTASRQCGVAG